MYVVKIDRFNSVTIHSSTFHFNFIYRFCVRCIADGLVMSLLRDDGRVNIATPASLWTPLIYFAVRGLHEQVGVYFD